LGAGVPAPVVLASLALILAGHLASPQTKAIGMAERVLQLLIAYEFVIKPILV
jgi:hypothetical protein